MSGQLKTLFEKALTAVGSYANDRNLGDVEGVGRLRYDDQGNVYRWVRNYHTVALTEGNVVSHTFSDTTTFLQKIRDGATADLGAMAGVVVATGTSVVGADTDGSTGDGDCCWIQIYGYNATINTLEHGSSAAAAGAFCPAVNAQLYCDAATEVAMGTAPTYARMIQVVTAAGTTGAAAINNGFIYCL